MSAEDRVRTATEATAASVRQIRPLTLPENSAVSAELREDRDRRVPRVSGALGKIKETWLIPLGAAAVVVALALTLVSLRHTEALGPESTTAGTGTQAVTGIPRYYAIATEGRENHAGKAAIVVTVGDTHTGKTFATVALPATWIPDDHSPVGISAAGDDRTFVVGRKDIDGNIAYFLLRIAPGTKQVATVKQLPVPETNPGVLLGFSVSPNGEELAVLSVRGNGTTLRIYSLTSGATLRTWTAGTWHYQGPGLQSAGVSWTADSRQVAFSTVQTTGSNTSSHALEITPSGVLGDTSSSGLEERLISATAPSGDLAATGKLVFKAPRNCSSILLTPDGGTVVCATQITDSFTTSASGSPQVTRPTDCGKDGPKFVAYSAATGKVLRVLYQYTGACDEGIDTVLWTDNSAQHVIGEQLLTQRNPPQHFDRYGVAGAGKFTEFSVAQHGQWYSGPAF